MGVDRIRAHGKQEGLKHEISTLDGENSSQFRSRREQRPNSADTRVLHAMRTEAWKGGRKESWNISAENTPASYPKR